MDILQALEQLDPTNDSQWTKDGAPRLDAVSDLLGVDVTRADIIKVAPFLTRENARDITPDQPGKDEEEHDEDTETLDLKEDEIPEGVSTSEAFQKLLKDQQIKIDTANSELDAAKVRVSKEVAKLDKIIIRKNQANLTNESFQPFKEYLEGQKQIRKERAMRYKKAMEAVHGLPLSNKSPLDQSYTRKNIRGTDRPQVPLKSEV